MSIEIDIPQTTQLIGTIVLWVIIRRVLLEKWKDETPTRKALIPPLASLLAIPIGFLLSVIVATATYDDSKVRMTPNVKSSRMAAEHDKRNDGGVR